MGWGLTPRKMKLGGEPGVKLPDQGGTDYRPDSGCGHSPGSAEEAGVFKSCPWQRSSKLQRGQKQRKLKRQVGS